MIPKPRAKVGDVVVFKAMNSIIQQGHVIEAVFKERWHYTITMREDVRWTSSTVVSDKEIFQNITTEEDFQEDEDTIYFTSYKGASVAYRKVNDGIEIISFSYDKYFQRPIL